MQQLSRVVAPGNGLHSRAIDSTYSSPIGTMCTLIEFGGAYDSLAIALCDQGPGHCSQVTHAIPGCISVACSAVHPIHVFHPSYFLSVRTNSKSSIVRDIDKQSFNIAPFMSFLSTSFLLVVLVLVFEAQHAACRAVPGGALATKHKQTAVACCHAQQQQQLMFCGNG